jgi:hypothetical protein
MTFTYRTSLLIPRSLKDVENDKFIAPDGTRIEDRLKLFVDRMAEDIKLCSNSCDTYMKKKLIAKVVLGPSWNAKFIEFVTLFTKRREEFGFELSIHIGQGIGNANAKLDIIGDKAHTLNEKFSFPYFPPDGGLNLDTGWTS